MKIAAIIGLSALILVGINGEAAAQIAIAGQNGRYTLVVGGVPRTFIVHVPSGYDKTARPLMIVYHAAAGSGANMQKTTGFDAVADADSFFVAYPDNATQGEWNTSGPTNDITFTKAMIQFIEQQYRIDPAQVFASGFSAGGNFVQVLACTMADWFAGFGNVSGALDSRIYGNCVPTRPTTAVLFYGTADPIVPYDGDYSSPVRPEYSAQQSAQFWAGLNGCQSAPSTTPFADTLSDGSSVTDTLESWSTCAAGTSISFYTIDGGGHAWPGSTDTAADRASFGPTSQGVDASQVIWQILSQPAPAT